MYVCMCYVRSIRTLDGMLRKCRTYVRTDGLRTFEQCLYLDVVVVVVVVVVACVLSAPSGERSSYKSS